MNKPPKATAIPVRLDAEEHTTLDTISKRTGMSKALLIRRALGFLLNEIKNRKGKAGWIVDELDYEKTLVSLPKPVFEKAMALAKAYGFSDSFSAFISHLIEERKRPKENNQPARR